MTETLRRNPETDRPFETLTEAESFAGEGQLACDRGRSVWPRFVVITTPKVGDEVSGYFNGDAYPEGVITRISESLRVVTTSTGAKFWRRRQSGTWLKDRTWSMVPGHRDDRNPHF